MADKKNIKWNAFTKGKLGKEALDKIGTYQEAPGGGTPLGKGQKAPSKEWVAENRVMQPRDEDGQFTYNSANAKELKYGPSRGKTIPPFLKGKELKFAEKGQILKTEDNGKWQISISTIDMSVEEMIERCKNYMSDSEGFAGMGEGSTIEKKGRMSKAEKQSGEGEVEGKKFDFSKAGKKTQEDLAKAEQAYGKKRKPIFATKEPKEPKAPKEEEPVKPQQTEEEQASKVFKEDLAPKDVEFNASEIGNTKESYKAWLIKNKDAVKKIKEKFPNVEYKHIIAAVKSGKYKKLSDFLGDK